jgi:hypothetical protein
MGQADAHQQRRDLREHHADRPQRGRVVPIDRDREATRNHERPLGPSVTFVDLDEDPIPGEARVALTGTSRTN